MRVKYYVTQAGVILFWLFLFPFSVFADDALSSAEFFAQFPDSQYKTQLVAKKNQLERIAKLMNLDISGLKFKYAPAISNAAYNSHLDYIQVNDPSYLNFPPVYAVSFFSHEYGHALFERMAQAQSAKYRKNREQNRQTYLDVDLLNAKVRDLTRAKMTLKGDALRANDLELAQAKMDLVALAQLVESFADSLRVSNSLVKSYNEFFADVLAVITNGDPKIVCSALGSYVVTLNLEIKPDSYTILDRCFDRYFDKQMEFTWGVFLHQNYMQKGVYDHYEVLAPLRSKFGYQFLTQSYSEKQLAKMLIQLSNVLISDLETRESISDPLEFNEALEAKIIQNVKP